MVEETFLTDEFLRQLINVGEVDILIGVPTHNNAKTIETVIQAIQAGILKCFPRDRVVIVNPDGGSRDGTPDIVTGASIDDVRHVSKLYTLRTLHCISTQYGENLELGTALRTILSAGELMRAKVCVVISPESTTIEPDWIQKLARPVYKDSFDLMTPIYRRHKFEGLLMRNLLYPMTRALYGYSLREPYAPEFAISGRLATDFLTADIWSEDLGRSGPEMCLATRAMTGNYRIGQSFLGTRAPVEGGSTDVVAAIRRTAGVLFSCMDKDFGFWSSQSEARTVTTAGPVGELSLDPVEVDRARLREIFSAGISQLEPVFRSILSANTLAELQRIAGLTDDNFSYPAELWVRTVYEFAASYHKSVINRDHIIQALAPLFRGRTLSFLIENGNSSAEQIEQSVESLCRDFERLKPYLLDVWKGGK